ncbi:hypothetical protein [Desulfosporosinus fructosivorans]
MNFSEVVERSVQIRKQYHQLERQYHEKEWTRLQYDEKVVHPEK